jgi:hypothetical protein
MFEVEPNVMDNMSRDILSNDGASHMEARATLLNDRTIKGNDGGRMCIHFWARLCWFRIFKRPYERHWQFKRIYQDNFTTRADIEHRKVSNMPSSNVVVVAAVVTAALIIIIISRSICDYRWGLGS